MSELIITMEDVRATKMCSSGTRKFFKRHNINWSDFLKNGVSAKVLENTGDAMALRVVEVARGRK